MLSHCVFPKKNLLNWLNLRVICNYTQIIFYFSAFLLFRGFLS
ncbi:unnamed protein product [Brassica rapa subsp. trilocularis]